MTNRRSVARWVARDMVALILGAYAFACLGAVVLLISIGRTAPESVVVTGGAAVGALSQRLNRDEEGGPMATVQRSRNHRPRPAPIGPPASRTWAVPSVLDQIEHGRCAAYAWAHATSATTGDSATIERCDELYRAAQRIDRWRGPHIGTTITACASADYAAKRVGGWRTASHAIEIAALVAHVAPVAIGVDWSAMLDEPDNAGRIRPGGRQLGRHAVAIVGVDVESHTFRVVNSWGEQWGDRGHASITWVDVDRLMRGGGAEAIAPNPSA